MDTTTPAVESQPQEVREMAIGNARYRLHPNGYVERYERSLGSLEFYVDPDHASVVRRVAELEKENAELRRWKEAVMRRHNGYDPEMREMMPALREPASPDAALDDLIGEAVEVGRLEERLQMQEGATSER